jgi:hypothetical protein
MRFRYHDPNQSAGFALAMLVNGFGLRVVVELEMDNSQVLSR